MKNILEDILINICIVLSLIGLVLLLPIVFVFYIAYVIIDKIICNIIKFIYKGVTYVFKKRK